jgi:hypothetical protein
VVAIALIFFAYVMNIGGAQVYLDGVFNGLDRSGRSENDTVANAVVSAVPYAEIGAIAVGVCILLMLLAKGLKSGAKAQRLSTRRMISVQEFIGLAAEQGVSEKVAKETYSLLLPHYSNRMRTRLTDSLASDLDLTESDQKDLFGNLLRQTDRTRDQHAGQVEIETVLDLMLAIERSPSRFVAKREPSPALPTASRVDEKQASKSSTSGIPAL